ncbi:hypothetical protein Tco_0070283, partial [Tanacetum coccineum]
MTTGSSTWTIGGWMSLVLSLGSTVSFVTSVPSYETSLLVVIAFNSPFGLAMVLLGREPELKDQFLTHPKLDELEL